MGKREKLVFQYTFFHRGQRSSTLSPLHLVPAPQNNTNRIHFKGRMRCFLGMSNFLSSFPDSYCLLCIAQVLLLLKAQTHRHRLMSSTSHGKDFPSGRQRIIFPEIMENRMKRECFSHHIFHSLSVLHYFHSQILKLFVIFPNM